LKFNIAVLPGDGIGPDVINEAIRVMETLGKRFGHRFNFRFGLVGGISIDKTGEALTQETL